LFFGNTTGKKHLSVGADLRDFAAQTDPKELEDRDDFSKQNFVDQGRVKTSDRQDGIGQKCWNLELLLPVMGAFITRYYEREQENNYWKAIEIYLMSQPLMTQRALYALLFHQVLTMLWVLICVVVTHSYITHVGIIIPYHYLSYHRSSKCIVLLSRILAYPETQASHGSRLTSISKIRRAYQHAYPR
jgi:hypothetical protein